MVHGGDSTHAEIYCRHLKLSLTIIELKDSPVSNVLHYIICNGEILKDSEVWIDAISCLRNHKHEIAINAR
jgi:hypothetical protein